MTDSNNNNKVKRSGSTLNKIFHLSHKTVQHKHLDVKSKSSSEELTGKNNRMNSLRKRIKSGSRRKKKGLDGTDIHLVRSTTSEMEIISSLDGLSQEGDEEIFRGMTLRRLDTGWYENFKREGGLDK